MDNTEKEYLESQGFNPENYEVVVWPESQNYSAYTEEDDVYLINDEEGYEMYGGIAFIIPKGLEPYEEREREYLESRGFNPDNYSVVCWPDSQEFLGHEDIELINDEEGYEMYGDSAYIVPNDLEPYEESDTERDVHNLSEDEAKDMLIGHIEEQAALIESITTAKLLLKECLGFIDVARFELGEDFDQSNLEAKVRLYLKDNV